MIKTRSVVIVKSELEPFRIPFYCRLGSALETSGVNLRVAVPRSRYDEIPSAEIRKWFIPVSTAVLRLKSRRVSIQWALPAMAHAELVVVQQNLLELANYLAFGTRRLLNFKLAFWGHGKNFKACETSLTEKVRRHLSLLVDFWFAYNGKSAQIVRELGFPSERICTVNNSIDTLGEAQGYDSITWDDEHRTKLELGIELTDKVAIYCGRFYHEKRLDYLIEAAILLRKRMNGFHLIIIGDGPDTSMITEFAAANSKWVHYVGCKFKEEKARYFKISDVFLLPGAVGLSIVDSFAYKTPLFTREEQSHGPEIDYLEHGKNGMITKNSTIAYVDAVECALSGSGLGILSTGCEAGRQAVTLEKMVENFASGVVAALEASRK